MGKYKSLALDDAKLALFKQYIPYVARFNFQNHGDADTMQEYLATLARCAKNWEIGREANFLTYLHTALINERTKVKRRYNRKNSLSLSWFSDYEFHGKKHVEYIDKLDKALGVEDEPYWDANYAARAVDQLRQRLRHSDWLLLRKRFIEGMLLQEIAEQSNCSKEWVRKLLDVAIDRARSVIERLDL